MIIFFFKSFLFSFAHLSFGHPVQARITIFIYLQKFTNKHNEKTNLDFAKKILIMTIPDDQYIPLSNHLKPFFNNYDWTIAKCNASVKFCIRKSINLNEGPIFEDLLELTKLSEHEITISVARPEGFDTTTIE